MNEGGPSIEKEPTEWIHDKKAVEDFSGTTLGQSDGMILRSGNKSIGHIVFTIESHRDLGNVLYIDYLRIEKRGRSPGVSIKLITALKAYAKEHNITHIGWDATRKSPMRNITNKITFRSPDPDREHLLTIEQLDVSMLTGRI